jgi:hypothetical protein
MVKLPRLLVILGFLAGSVAAQSVTRLETTADNSPGKVTLRVLRETAGVDQVLPLPGAEITGWLFLREEGRQENLDRFPEGARDRIELSLRRHDERPAVVGMDSPARVESVTAEGLASFLSSRAGLPAVRVQELRRESGRAVRVQRLESTACVLPGADAAGPSEVVTSKRGQRMEVRLLIDPATLATGTQIPFRIYLPPDWDPAPTLGASARRLEDGARAELRLFEDRSGFLVPSGAGTWLIEVHAARRSVGGTTAGEAPVEWVLVSSTLVFPFTGESSLRDEE